MELDRVWAAKGYRPHDRAQQGMNEMIAAWAEPWASAHGW
jgi:hypothetical protein